MAKKPKQKPKPKDVAPKGRPKAQIDPKDVESLGRIGCTNEEIATILGVSADTIERRFAGDIKKGRMRFRESLRRMQIRSAMGYWEEDKETGERRWNAPSPVMQIWLGKNCLDQTDRQDLTLGMNADKPIEVTVRVVNGPSKRNGKEKD